MILMNYEDVVVGDCIMGYHECGIIVIGEVTRIYPCTDHDAKVEFKTQLGAVIYIRDNKAVHGKQFQIIGDEECSIFSNETIYLLSKTEIGLYYLIHNI